MAKSPRFLLDQNSGVPFYRQIHDQLLADILSGVRQPGSSLPAESRLAQEYGVNRLTVRRAVTELVNAGYLERRHGVGTFVQRRTEPSQRRFLADIGQLLVRQGYAVEQRIIEQREVEAGRTVSDLLGIEPGTRIWECRRLQMADSRPAAIETLYYPEQSQTAVIKEELGGSLSRVVATLYPQNAVTECLRWVEPVRLSDWEAGSLWVEADSLGLRIDILVRGQEQRPLLLHVGLVSREMSRLLFAENFVRLVGEQDEHT